MRKTNTQSLAEVIRQLLKEQHLDDKLNDRHIIDAWSVVLGPNISQYTTSLSVCDQTLYVSLSSAVLRHELFLSKQEILSALNRHVGAEVIRDIVFR